MPLDHVGVAVARIADALALWEPVLGVRAGPVEEVPSQKVRVAFLDASGTHIELLEPTDPESAVGRFLAARGPGLHHVAFAVPSVDAALATAAERGQRLIDRVGRPGARGRRVGFVHPASMAGTLVEFVEGP
ncbi:MAG TPA: methylmalonyl-CoA epimerase [Thermoplasmata archaeon]|nr:methylmalonyl-CoA epimerase [Thermoplasmata archaeon]